MLLTRTLCCAALVLAGSVSGAARIQAPRTPPAVPSRLAAADDSPEQATRAFLRAFDRLEWDQFRSYFADDMTMFFPFAQTPSRVDGREAIEKVFDAFFRAKRQQLADAGLPMTQGLNPRDMKVQLAGTEAAVVTFHLGADTSPSRRSLVLLRTAGKWKIIHWHASNTGTAASGLIEVK